MATFKKPPGEQTSYEESPPVRKPPKRIRTPPVEERPISQPRKSITPPVTTPITSPRATSPPTHEEEPVHHDEEQHTPRIYTEETVVNYFEIFVSYIVCLISIATRNTCTIC